MRWVDGTTLGKISRVDSVPLGMTCLHNWKVLPSSGVTHEQSYPFLFCEAPAVFARRHRAHFTCILAFMSAANNRRVLGWSDTWKLLGLLAQGLDPGCSPGQDTGAPGVQCIVV